MYYIILTKLSHYYYNWTNHIMPLMHLITIMNTVVRILCSLLFFSEHIIIISDPLFLFINEVNFHLDHILSWFV